MVITGRAEELGGCALMDTTVPCRRSALFGPVVPESRPEVPCRWVRHASAAPVVTLGALLLLAIWWMTSAKHWFTGPKHTIDEAVLEAFDEKLTAD